MSWSPSFADAQPDPRLDPYRGRVAVATRYGEPAGHLLVETDYLAERISGRLWWRRWATPTEYAQVFTQFPEHPSTEPTWVLPAEIDELVAIWATGRHIEDGTAYGITWLGAAEAERVHREVFRHQH